MSPIQVLRNHFVGKTVVSGPIDQKFIGLKILAVDCHAYESGEFVFQLEDPNQKGRVTRVAILDDWDVEVK